MLFAACCSCSVVRPPGRSDPFGWTGGAAPVGRLTGGIGWLWACPRFGRPWAHAFGTGGCEGPDCCDEAGEEPSIGPKGGVPSPSAANRSIARSCASRTSPCMKRQRGPYGQRPVRAKDLHAFVL